MSWKEMSSMVRRVQFAKLALEARESMAQLCRRFGISRKTGYKWKQRFEREGCRGMRDKIRRPQRSPRQTSEEWLKWIRKARRVHRTWGSRKLAPRLRQQQPG